MFLTNSGNTSSSPMTIFYIVIGVLIIAIVIFTISLVSDEKNIFRGIKEFFTGSSSESSGKSHNDTIHQVRSIGSSEDDGGTDIGTQINTPPVKKKKSGKR